HAPHPGAESERDMLGAPCGIANLGVTFPLLSSRLVATGRLELATLLHLLQDGPAGVMGWPAPRLDAGAPADVTLLDLDTPPAVDGARFASKAKCGPREGGTLSGRPTATLVRGLLALQRT